MLVRFLEAFWAVIIFYLKRFFSEDNVENVKFLLRDEMKLPSFLKGLDA